MNCNLKITLAIIILLNLSYSIFSCPNWESSDAYSTGDVISYNGTLFEAVREIPINTPPIVSDNGWFWIETNAACNESISSEAHSFEVIIDKNNIFTKTVKMDSSGLNIRKVRDGGGGSSSIIGYDYISVGAAGPKGASSCTISPNAITISESQVGPKPEFTTLTGSKIMTSGTIETESNVKCNDIILRNASLVQKILDLESRLLELENR